MTTAKALTLAFLGLVWLAGAPACGGNTETGPGQVGGNTNWLKRCSTADDCGEFSCQCGVCTPDCGSELPVCDGAPTELCTAVREEALSHSGETERESRIGLPCVFSDENNTLYSGIDLETTHIDDTSGNEVCLVRDFQGRTTCPYGSDPLVDDGRPQCLTPAGDPVTVAVEPQLRNRPPSTRVHTSCRCADPDGTPVPGCTCPSGMQCEQLIEDLGVGDNQYAGAYCIMPDPQTLQLDVPCEYDDSLVCGPPRERR